MADEPPFNSREHALLVGVLINLRTIVRGYEHDMFGAFEAMDDVMGTLRAYDEAMADE